MKKVQYKLSTLWDKLDKLFRMQNIQSYKPSKMKFLYKQNNQ